MYLRKPTFVTKAVTQENTLRDICTQTKQLKLIFLLYKKRDEYVYFLITGYKKISFEKKNVGSQKIIITHEGRQ